MKFLQIDGTPKELFPKSLTCIMLKGRINFIRKKNTQNLIKYSDGLDLSKKELQ